MIKKVTRFPLRVAFWPVTMISVAFALVMILSVFLPQKTWDRWEDKLVDTTVLVIATFVSAWAGGASAFRVERKTQETSARRAQISAANSAFFTIATAYLAFENLRAHYIDVEGRRNDPHRALKIDSPQPGMLAAIEFDFSGLSYILDQPGDASQIMMEFVLFQWKYQILLQTVEHRASATEDLHKASVAKPPADKSPDGIKAAFPSEYRKLDATTDQIVASVDNGVQDCKQLDDQFRAALQKLFPGQEFLRINFQTALAD